MGKIVRNIKSGSILMSAKCGDKQQVCPSSLAFEVNLFNFENDAGGGGADTGQVILVQFTEFGPTIIDATLFNKYQSVYVQATQSVAGDIYALTLTSHDQDGLSNEPTDTVIERVSVFQHKPSTTFPDAYSEYTRNHYINDADGNTSHIGIAASPTGNVDCNGVEFQTLLDFDEGFFDTETLVAGNIEIVSRNSDGSEGAIVLTYPFVTIGNHTLNIGVGDYYVKVTGSTTGYNNYFLKYPLKVS